jgi:nitrite reductase (NO-forming)
MMAKAPKSVMFNGAVNKHVAEPLQARPGELVRIHVVNAGPGLFSAFHVIGGIFDKVYESGNPANVLRGIQTWTIPPGGGATFDIVFPEAGTYPFVTHSIPDALHGGLGLIRVSE